MDVVAQWVRTWWTKQARSGADARRRNALPVSFTLPEVAPPLVHSVVMREWDHGFAPRSTVTHDVPDRGDVLLREADGLLRVMLVAAQYPGVIRRRPPALRLRPGEWVRWQITYRRASSSGRGPWYYSLDTLNLAYGPPPAPDTFLGEPTRLVDERRQLTRCVRVNRTSDD